MSEEEIRARLPRGPLVQGAPAARLVTLVDCLAGVRELLALADRNLSEAAFLGQAMTILGASQDVGRCSVYTFAGRRLVCAAAARPGDDEAPVAGSPLEFAFGEGLVGEAARTRALLHVADCRADPRFRVPPPEAGHADPRDLLCVPLVARERLFGVLNVSWSRPAVLQGWQVNALAVYGQLLAQSLHYHALLESEGRVAPAPRRRRKSP